MTSKTEIITLKNIPKKPKLRSSFENVSFLSQMVFYASSRVTLLFDFWNVREPVGKCVKSQKVLVI